VSGMRSRGSGYQGNITVNVTVNATAKEAGEKAATAVRSAFYNPDVLRHLGAQSSAQ